jgi:LmbE family N-acetylglucosaminyl deacetylase
MNLKSILIVVAHPDDEALGAGGLIHKLSSDGIEINCMILSGNVEARSTKPSKDKVNLNIKAAGKILGINDHIIGDFKNIEFNMYPHLEIVKFIENGIDKYNPTTILTHHMSDINDDHVITSKACLAASRFYQRRNIKNNLKNLLTMEILSSTDWSFPSSDPYQPNTYCSLRKEDLDKKIDALEAYQDILRPDPHPRSISNIKSLASIRGSEYGCKYAESYQSLFALIDENGV